MTATLRPDLVTMDLMMPGMDGMEATRRIMARHPTPVLFLSSFFDKEGTYSRADAIAAGALDVVEKPALMPDWRWHNAAGKLVQKVKVAGEGAGRSRTFTARASCSRRKHRSANRSSARPPTSSRSAPPPAARASSKRCSRACPRPMRSASSSFST